MPEKCRTFNIYIYFFGFYPVLSSLYFCWHKVYQVVITCWSALNNLASFNSKSCNAHRYRSNHYYCCWGHFGNLPKVSEIASSLYCWTPVISFVLLKHCEQLLGWHCCFCTVVWIVNNTNYFLIVMKLCTGLSLPVQIYREDLKIAVSALKKFKSIHALACSQLLTVYYLLKQNHGWY